MIEQVQSTVNSAPAQAATYGGAGGAFVLWGLHLSDLGVIVSAIVALAGFAVQLYLAVVRERREREFYRQRMETMRDDADTSRTSGQKARIDSSSSAPPTA